MDKKLETHLATIRQMNVTTRWAIVRTSRKPNLAEHSYFVAYLAQLINEDCDLGIDRGSVLWAGMTHDCREIFSGDIAAPAYRFIKENCTEWSKKLHSIADRQGLRLEEPSELLRLLVSIADVLEAIIFLQEEIDLGNKCVSRQQQSLKNILMERTGELDQSYHPNFSANTSVRNWCAVALTADTSIFVK